MIVKVTSDWIQTLALNQLEKTEIAGNMLNKEKACSRLTGHFCWKEGRQGHRGSAHLDRRIMAHSFSRNEYSNSRNLTMQQHQNSLKKQKQKQMHLT